MKVVGAADLHLDSTMVGGWDSNKNMHSNWVEAQKMLGNIVDICNDEDADLMVVAGDMWHTGIPKPEAVRLAKKTLSRLRRTKVILVAGNHDQQGVVSRHSTPVEAYFEDQKWCLAAVNSPRVIEYEGLALALSPWMKVAGSSVLERANSSLKDSIEKLGEEVGDRPSLFFGHVTLDEVPFVSSARGSERDMMATILEASVPANILDQGPWSLARLGHIHKRSDLTPKTGYIGSTYKVTFSEAREEKGCDVIEMKSDGTANLSFNAFDVRQLIRVDATEIDSLSEIIRMVGARRAGDIVKIDVDESGGPEGLSEYIDELKGRRAQVRLSKLGSKKLEVSENDSQIRIGTLPKVALQSYLEEKDDLTSTDVKRIMDMFQDISVEEEIV